MSRVAPISAVAEESPKGEDGGACDTREFFQSPPDWELLQKVGAELVSLATGVTTLYILTTYAALQYSDNTSALYVGFQLHTMIFPLIAMGFISDMFIEYTWRELVYYRLLDEGVLVDLSDEGTLQSFIKSSWIAWYIIASTVLLVWSVLFKTIQWAAIFTIVTLSGALIGKVYKIRTLEARLISVNKFIERDYVKASQFLANVAKNQHIVSEGEVRLAVLAVKLAYARVDHEHQQKRGPFGLRGSKEDDRIKSAQYAELRERGVVLDFAQLALELKGRPRMCEDDLAQAFKEFKAQTSAFGSWFKLSQRLTRARWASCAFHVYIFTRKEDVRFCKVLLNFFKASLVALLVVEVYGAVALSTGEAACLTGDDS